MELSNRQKVIKELYDSGMSGRKISQHLQLSRHSVYTDLSFIIHGKNMLIKNQEKPVASNIILETPDTLVEKMNDAQFTEEQKEFVLQNKNLTRTELAKRLNLNKTIFNHMLQKEKIFI